MDQIRVVRIKLVDSRSMEIASLVGDQGIGSVKDLHSVLCEKEGSSVLGITVEVGRQ